MLHVIVAREKQGWLFYNGWVARNPAWAWQAAAASLARSHVVWQAWVRIRLVLQCSLKIAHKGKLGPDLTSSTCHHDFYQQRSWPWAWPAQQPRLTCTTGCCPKSQPAAGHLEQRDVWREQSKWKYTQIPGNFMLNGWFKSGFVSPFSCFGNVTGFLKCALKGAHTCLWEW